MRINQKLSVFICGWIITWFATTVTLKSLGAEEYGKFKELVIRIHLCSSVAEIL